jgi:hypothetical protein
MHGGSSDCYYEKKNKKKRNKQINKEMEFERISQPYDSKKETVLKKGKRGQIELANKDK